MVNPIQPNPADYFDQTTVREMKHGIGKLLEAAGLAKGIHLSAEIVDDFLARKAWGEIAENEIDVIKIKLNECGVKDSDLHSLAEKIHKIQKVFVPQDPVARSGHAPVPIGLILDLNAKDHNGAMTIYMRNFLTAGQAFVTSLSIFGGYAIDFKATEKRLTFDDYKSIEKTYEIYVSGAFVICLPKKVEDTATPEERLKHYGINTDNVRLTHIKELLDPQETISTWPDLKEVFVTDPVNDRVVFLTGHGSVNQPASLSTEEYCEMLKWLETQHCKGLEVASCYSGGRSTALHLPELTSKSEHPVKFPVLIQSTGEFCRQGRLEAWNGTIF